MAAEVAAAGDHGMRAAAATEVASLGEVTEVLARARTIEELKRAIDGGAAARGRRVGDLAPRPRRRLSRRHHRPPWSADSQRYRLEDYPTTAHVVDQQAIGQVIAGDPASDPAELKVLEIAGMSAVLLMRSCSKRHDRAARGLPSRAAGVDQHAGGSCACAGKSASRPAWRAIVRVTQLTGAREPGSARPA